MDEKARNNIRAIRTPDNLNFVHTDYPQEERKNTLLTASNRSVFVDWEIPDQKTDNILSIPSVCWFSPLHNILLDFGGFDVFLEFLGENKKPWRVYSWYGDVMLPCSSIIISETLGNVLKVFAYCLMKPEENKWTLAFKIENFSGKNLPDVKLKLKGTYYVGKERGSILDPVNPVTGKDNLLRGIVKKKLSKKSIILSNPPANTFLCFSANKPLSNVLVSTRGTKSVVDKDKTDNLRQAVDFQISVPVKIRRSIKSQWLSFEWEFSNNIVSNKEMSCLSLRGAKRRGNLKDSWNKKCSYIKTIETPFPILTEALKKSIIYARSCLTRANEDKVFAICSHYEFPVDCPRDTFAMNCLMQYLEPELARKHLENYFLYLIPEQGLGVSYSGWKKKDTNHRLLDLACYPFLGLSRYSQVVGSKDIKNDRMRLAVKNAIDKLFTFNDDGINGLITSNNRSSDEDCVFPIFVPGNIQLVCVLERMNKLLKEVYDDVKQAERCKKWANNLRLALEKNAIIRDKEFGDIWTFEIDGKGKYLLYDQADYPNLLTIPYFGFCKFEDKIYQNTRKFIFSPRNAGYKHTIGRYSALCDGSKQDPQNPWALGIMGELMANPTSQQARKTFDWLENALTSTLTLSETADKYRGRNNGHTFGWATSLMSLLYIEIICGFKPRAKKIIPCVPNGWEKFKSPVIKFHGKPMVLKYESNKTKISLM